MSLESGTRIADLVATNPVGATDFASQGDDHIRLIKACLQGSFPSLGATAVTATADELNILDGATLSVAELNTLDGITATTAELNKLAGTPAGLTSTELGYMDGVTSAVQTQLDALSSSISGLSSVYQPLDSDLTALAALTTASYGLDFNTLANNAALATKIAALVPTWSGLHTFTGGVTHAPASGYPSINVNAVTNGYSALSLNDHAGTRKLEFLYATSGAGGAYDIAAGLAGINAQGLFTISVNDTKALQISAAQVVSISDAGTMREVGYRQLPPRAVSGADNTTTGDNGKCIYYTGGAATFTIDSDFSVQGNLLTIVNNGSGNLTIAETLAGVMVWMNGSGATSTGSRTLAVGGVATIWMLDGTNAMIWGTGIS